MTFECSPINTVQMKIMEYLTDEVKYIKNWQDMRIYLDEYEGTQETENAV